MTYESPLLAIVGAAASTIRGTVATGSPDSSIEGTQTKAEDIPAGLDD